MMAQERPIILVSALLKPEKIKLVRKKKSSTGFYFLVSLAVVVLSGSVGATLLYRSSDAEAGQGQINDRSRICMLQDTLQTRSGLTYVYNSKKYYLYCGGCLAGFRRDAAIYSHAADPIDGKSVDKADAPAYGYKGHAYFFSSTANMSAFADDPEKFVASAPSDSAQK
jgi:YHS domain-containing protein